MRKAQISVFMIIVVLLLLVFGFIFYMLDGLTIIRGEKLPEVHSHIQDCASQTLEDGLIKLGQQGGRITLKEPIFDQTSVLLQNSSSYIPSVEEVESELETHVKNNIRDCIDFEAFKGISLSKEDEPDPTVIIGKRDVTLKLNYILTFKKGEKIITLEDYVVSKDVGMLQILNVVNKIIMYQIENGMILDNIMQEHQNFQFRIAPYNDHLLISIKDTNYMINNKPYEFVFAEYI